MAATIRQLKWQTHWQAGCSNDKESGKDGSSCAPNDPTQFGANSGAHSGVTAWDGFGINSRVTLDGVAVGISKVTTTWDNSGVDSKVMAVTINFGATAFAANFGIIAGTIDFGVMAKEVNFGAMA